MARRKTGAGKSTAIATLDPQPVTSIGATALAAAIGSKDALARLQGPDADVTRQEGVVRVSGCDYRTSGETVPGAEVYFVKGDKPREEGVWLGEADKVAWLDPETGLECIMLRNRHGGFLSGYVGVPTGHTLFGWQHGAVPVDLGVEVHGGLTYSRICDDGPSPQRRLVIEARRICHVIVGEIPLEHASDHRPEAGQWWFGFDCNHVYDVVPGDLGDRGRFMGVETEAEYRDDGYVFREVRNLARQLKAIGDGLPVPPRDGPPLPPIGLDPMRGGR